MASILNVDALQGVTAAGSILVTGEGNSTTTNLQQGLAKVWVHHDASAVVQNSLNVSGATDLGTGLFKSSFTNSLANNNFSAGGLAGISGNYTAMGVDNNNTGFSTGFISVVITRTDSGARVDPPDITSQIYGDLA